MGIVQDVASNNVWRRVPAAALPQLIQDRVHARVAMVVVVATTLLAALGKIPADVTGAVYTGVVGYVAGRAGNINRGAPSRTEDNSVNHVRGSGASR